jgi:hypothetical protein
MGHLGRGLMSYTCDPIPVMQAAPLSRHSCSVRRMPLILLCAVPDELQVLYEEDQLTEWLLLEEHNMKWRMAPRTAKRAQRVPHRTVQPLEIDGSSGRGGDLVPSRADGVVDPMGDFRLADVSTRRVVRARFHICELAPCASHELAGMMVCCMRTPSLLGFIQQALHVAFLGLGPSKPGWASRRG